MNTEYNPLDRQGILLSFIVPVYNVGKYVEDCLDSLLNQDIKKENYEIICVDDGSTDGSAKILDKYASENSNIVVIHTDNGGVSSARNCGIEKAKGQYIWFIDSDDWIQHNCLKHIFLLVDKFKPDIVRVGLERVMKIQDRTLLANSYSIKKFRYTPSVCATLIKSEIIIKNKIRFNSKIKYGEDALFQSYVYLYLTKERCLFIKSTIYYYRQNISSATHNNLATERWPSDLLDRIIIYKNERTQGHFKNKEKFLKKMQYECTFNFLTQLPFTKRNYQETIAFLKQKQVYPIPFQWGKLKVKGFKNKIMNLYRIIFFRSEFLYKFYYNKQQKSLK